MYNRIARLMVQRAQRKAFHAKGSNPLSNWWLVNTQFLVNCPRQGQGVNMKPTLVKLRNIWWCRSHMCVGSGGTPAEAYREWCANYRDQLKGDCYV